MATPDDTLTRPKSSLLAGLASKTAAKPPPLETAEAAGPGLPDAITPLPQPGDPYKAHARPDNKALLTLRFLLKDSASEGFAYSDLRRIRFLPADGPGGGPYLLLRFVEAVVTDVRIEGRHLDSLHDYLGYHRIGWARELSPGKMLGDTSATVITKITITQVEN